MDMLVASETFVFEGWRFDVRAGSLLRQDPNGNWGPVSIGTRARDILALLLEQPGALVSKEAIMDAVWPNVAVEPNNLTVQIAALRRVLDGGRVGDSCIQTVAGRGYRFAPRVARLHEARSEPESQISLPDATTQVPRTRWRWLVAGVGSLAVAALAIIAIYGGWFAGRPPLPRLSLVVLPFENLGGDQKDDYLAEGITDDLTSDLAHVRNAYVVAPASAYSYKAKPVDVRKIGNELGVRSVLKGSMQRIGSTLKVNVQLISTETGAQLWSDRIDEQISDLASGQDQIVMRLSDELAISMVDIENARSLRERPTNPDAADLILRARALEHLPASLQQDGEALALYERALSLDPSSPYAMTGVAYFLTDKASAKGWDSFDDMQRAGRLLARARTIKPESDMVLNSYVYWLRTVGRCPEAIEAAQRAIQTDPNQARVWTGLYNELAVCKSWTGHAEEAIALQQKADELNPRSPWKFSRYQHMGFDSLMLGRDADAIELFQRSFALDPEVHGGTQWDFRYLAAAYARTGQMQEARRYLSAADRLWPYDTVRSHFPDYLSSPVYVEQIRHYQEGLRLAGERDHADEDADFGVPTDGALHSEFAGHTAMGAPGARTIRTADLFAFLAEARVVVIDTVTYSWGRSIPDAVGLKFAGLGGTFTDEAQDHLRDKMRELTAGDLDRPIVAVGWNSERFDGRNLALRLVALGYRQVFWYRGGREAWEVSGLPEGELDVQQW
ncbi:MAG: winged helix-turn-helix domain-containing protein [Acetobacteraceae bacterium]